MRVQRWTAKRRAAPVTSLLNGETTVAHTARRHGLKVAEMEEWQERRGERGAGAAQREARTARGTAKSAQAQGRCDR